MSLQKQFPLRQEKPYPAWVQTICVVLCLPTLWVPAVVLAQLFARHRRKQENVQQDMHLKLQDSVVC